MKKYVLMLILLTSYVSSKAAEIIETPNTSSIPPLKAFPQQLKAPSRYMTDEAMVFSAPYIPSISHLEPMPSIQEDVAWIPNNDIHRRTPQNIAVVYAANFIKNVDITK